MADVIESTVMWRNAAESVMMNATHVKKSPDCTNVTAVMAIDQILTPNIIW